MTNKSQVRNERAKRSRDEKKVPEEAPLWKKYSIPLFVEESSEGEQGNAQDEKDTTEE